MKPRILLIGSSGQIGYELKGLLPGVGAITAPDRRQLDLLDTDALRRTIQSVKPELIVNAAAYTAVDKAESDEANAYAINAIAPEIMAEEARRIGAALIHYSTDYVFDGSKGAPYEETDPTNPLNVYGRTKLAGEAAIRASGVPHLIFRTAWVYSARGRNFLRTIVRLASEREELSIVEDQIGTPTWSREVAGATNAIIASLQSTRGSCASVTDLCGTYHLTADGQSSWYDFACAILDEAKNAPGHVEWLTESTSGWPLTPTLISPITSDEYAASARRPAYSVLSNALLARTFGIRLAHWREQLHTLFCE